MTLSSAIASTFFVATQKYLGIQAKIFYLKFMFVSKANLQQCDQTEAMWLAESPNLAQNGLRNLCVLYCRNVAFVGILKQRAGLVGFGF